MLRILVYFQDRLLQSLNGSFVSLAADSWGLGHHVHGAGHCRLMHGGLTRSSEKNQPKKSNSTRQFDLMTETRIARAGSYIPKPTENDDENSTPNSRLMRHSVASCMSPNHNSDMDEKFTVMTQPIYRVTNPAD
jgi:hypothetical protein